MLQRTRWVAWVIAAVVALMMAAPASGYQGQVAGSVTISVNGSGRCGTPIAVSAAVLDADGKPIVRQSVDWTLVLTLSPGDSIDRTPTVTNRQGVAKTTVTLACVNGSRRIRATAGPMSAQAVLGLTVHALPNTSTLPTTAPASSVPLAALLVAIGCALGGALTLRRLA